MSIKTFFTSFHDSLSDLKTYYDFKKELGMRLVEDEFFNNIEGKRSFNAFVLEVDSSTPSVTTNKTSGGRYKIIKVRPVDLHDSIIPEPCEFKTAEYIQQIVDMHPTAYSDGINPSISLSVGDIVECYFEEQGPEFEGKMRGLRYRDNTQQRLPAYYKYACLKNYKQQRSKAVFKESPKKLLKPHSLSAARKKISRRKLPRQTRTIDFESIMFQLDESSCRPANISSTNIKEFLGDKQWNLYLRIGRDEGGSAGYAALNYAGYAGKYQMSLGNLQRHHNLFHKDKYDNFRARDLAQVRSNGSAYKQFIKDSSNYKGTGGVKSWKDFINPAIGGKLQEKGMISYTSSNFRALIRNGSIPDLNNLPHIVGMLAAAHLKGPGARIKSRKTGKYYKTGALLLYKEGRDVPDGSGVYPAYYYVKNGNLFKSRCGK
jgi:hypothetical protein